MRPAPGPGATEPGKQLIELARPGRCAGPARHLGRKSPAAPRGNGSIGLWCARNGRPGCGPAETDSPSGQTRLEMEIVECRSTVSAMRPHRRRVLPTPPPCAAPARFPGDQQPPAEIPPPPASPDPTPAPRPSRTGTTGCIRSITGGPSGRGAGWPLTGASCCWAASRSPARAAALAAASGRKTAAASTAARGPRRGRGRAARRRRAVEVAGDLGEGLAEAGGGQGQGAEDVVGGGRLAQAGVAAGGPVQAADRLGGGAGQGDGVVAGELAGSIICRKSSTGVLLPGAGRVGWRRLCRV